MIVAHHSVLSAADPAQPWAENCCVAFGIEERVVCYDVAYLSERAYEATVAANLAIARVIYGHVKFDGEE